MFTQLCMTLYALLLHCNTLWHVVTPYIVLFVYSSVDRSDDFDYNLYVKIILKKSNKNKKKHALKSKLRNYNITAAEFAKHVGFRYQTVQRWLDGSLEIPDEIADQVIFYSMSRIISSGVKETIRAKKSGSVVWSRNRKPIHPKGLSIKEINKITREMVDKYKAANPHIDELDLSQKVAKEQGFLSYKIIRESYLDGKNPLN